MSDTHDGGRRPFDECSDISPLCPVEATVLGYFPNLGSGIFFSIVFGLCTIYSAYLTVRKRTWTYGAALTTGALLECLGYIGRILLNSNPWDSGAFQLQICTIIIAPTFICASIYLTLKHVAINLNPSLSRIPPQWYPRIFLPADLSCLVVQAIGGGIAAAAGRDDANLLKSGNNAIIAGIVLQVVVLAIFGLLGVDYYFRARRYMASPDVNPESLAIWRDSKTRTFGCAVMVAYAAVLIRCIYRIAEMAGGWGNHIMQDEPSFLVLDASLVAVAVTLLTVVHPGIYFPYMRNTRKPKAEKESPAESSSEAPKVAEAGV